MPYPSWSSLKLSVESDLPGSLICLLISNRLTCNLPLLNQYVLLSDPDQIVGYNYDGTYLRK